VYEALSYYDADRRAASCILFTYIDLAEGPEAKVSVEVELRKPRNLFVCVTEERQDGKHGDGEGKGLQAPHCVHV
jgi:hypothetical protein